MKKTFGFSLFDLLHFILFILMDSVTIGVCLWGGHALWGRSDFRLQDTPSHLNFNFLLVGIGIILLTLMWRGEYRFHSSIMHVVKLKNLISSIIIGFTLVIVIGFFTKNLMISRLWAVYSFALLLPGMIIERAIVEECWKKCVAKGIRKRKVLVYGAGFTGKRLVRSIRKLTKSNYEVVGFIDDFLEKGCKVMSNPIHVLGRFDDIPELVEMHRIDRLLITMPNVTLETMRKIFRLCERLKIKYKFVPGLHDVALHRVQMELLDGIPLFSQKSLRLKRFNCFTKRILDILLSTAALIVFSPILSSIALWIKKNSPGPIIFRQRRVGKDGKEFDFYKFRSLYVDSEKYARKPQNGDDLRITKCGRFLRKTSLDELPQFWNVLKGDMSIVGPRPEMPFIVETYNDTQRERLNVKPGITGIWQISADRALPIHENIDHDLYYIEHQSLLLDIVIIVETLFFVMRGIGAV